MSQNNYTCPLRMSDGRSMTDYRPKCIVNYDLMNKMEENNLVKSSYDTRMYLQKNADNIMKQEFEKSKNNLLPCIKCNDPLTDVVEMPQKYYVTCDNISCTKKLFDINGLGSAITNTAMKNN